MKQTRINCVAPLLAMLLASRVEGQTVTTAASDTVEIIGLRDWTVRMLEDSLQKYRPGVTLGDAACGAILRDSLGFPDAAVFRFRDQRVVLTVIEPADSQRVVLNMSPRESGTFPGPWHRLRELQETATFAVDFAISTYLRHSAGEAIAVDPGDSAIVRKVWSLLSAPTDIVQWRSNVAALTHSSDPATRRAAASYLVRYPQRDSTWYALVHALRDPDWSVRGSVNATLRSFRISVPRRIDWSPAVADLRHLLDGTTLVYQVEVVKLLLATDVSSKLTPTLLSADGTRLLLAQMAANHEYVRMPATDLLRRLSGIDHMAEPAKWTQWVRQQSRTRNE